MWAGGSHAVKLEYDLRHALERRLHASVPLAEAAFNRLNPIVQPAARAGHRLLPVRGERRVVYATAYNASAATDAPFLGRAWVARGIPRAAPR